MNDGDEEDLTTLYAAEMDIVEQLIAGVVADDIREDLGLPYLEWPWSAGHLPTEISHHLV
jgi:hypothetical protein